MAANPQEIDANRVLSVVLAVGMSWSHLSRRITGQSDTDVVD